MDFKMLLAIETRVFFARQKRYPILSNGIPSGKIPANFANEPLQRARSQSLVKEKGLPC